jgi:hypothetical protein
MSHTKEFEELSTKKKIKTPKITIFIEGGTIHGYRTKGVKGLKVDVIDYDIDGIDKDTICRCKKAIDSHYHHKV